MRRMKLFVLFAAAMCLAGCGNESGNNKAAGNMQSNVDKVMEEQMKNSDGDNADASTEAAGETKDDVANQAEPGEKNLDNTVSYDNIDYDLTSMNSDMVYSTVYQMMNEPKAYEGKVVRMNGAYIVNYWESTDTYYHCVLIKDAQACCQQGIEFVWGDGNHKYPDDYPKENSQVMVTGVFETYTEDGDSTLYCRLNSASMEVQ